MHSSVCGPHRDMVCSSCKTSNPITVSGLNHSYPYKTRLAVIISVKIFRIYVNIKEFSFTGAAWSVSDRRDPTQVLGHRGWLPAAAGPHPAATWPNTGTQGRQAGRMHRQRKKPRNNCEDVWKLIIFFFALVTAHFFSSDFRSEFTLRPKPAWDLFPSLKSIACRKTFHSSRHMQPAHD